MNQSAGWIKLHRIALENEIITDSVAWQVFSYILLKVDKDGTYTTGRIYISEALKLPQTTVRDALKRLFVKYHVLELTPTTKYTKIRVLNWDKYQGSTTETANKPPTNRQQTATKQEYKNKEYINTNVLIPETPKLIEQITPIPKPSLTRKGHPYTGIIAYCREKQGIVENFANYGKQLKACKNIFEAGYTEEKVRFVIDEMVMDDFWKANPFDMMSVANAMHKYLNRTVMFKKNLKGGKYAYN